MLSESQVEGLLQELRSHYYQPPNLLQRALGLVASGKYAQQPIVFDISHWNSNGSGVSAINFSAFATYPQFAGWYVKLGEVGKLGKPFTMESDAWFDDMFTTFWNAIEKYPKWWRAPYLYHNSTWMDDYGQTMVGLDNILDQPATQSNDDHAKQLCQDPNVYLLVRRYMKAGRVFGGAELKNIMANGTYLKADAIVVDFEKYWDNAGRTIVDIHLGKTLDTTMKALVWLQQHGYMPNVMLIIYTSEWFLKAYANVYGRQVCNNYNTIAAGYYWNNTKVTTTFQGMMDQIAGIPNDWHPVYVGAAIPGMRDQFLQISGDHFVLDVHPYALDCNVFNGTWAEMEATFPLWKARRNATPEPDPDPNPEPEPQPGPTLSIPGTYTSQIVNQYVRSAPTTVGSNTLGTIAKGIVLTPCLGATDELNSLNSWRYFENIPTLQGTKVKGWLAYYNNGSVFLKRTL